MSATSYIVVFRPHQRPAWAEIFDSEIAFYRAWQNGFFAKSCHAEPSGDDEISFDAAWESVSHDLHALTRLDSPEEACRYLAEREYAGQHNKALSAVKSCARQLGWLPGEAEEEEEAEDDG